MCSTAMLSDSLCARVVRLRLGDNVMTPLTGNNSDIRHDDHNDSHYRYNKITTTLAISVIIATTDVSNVARLVYMLSGMLRASRVRRWGGR